MSAFVIYSLAAVITLILLSVLARFGLINKTAKEWIVPFSVFWWAFWPLALSGLFYNILFLVSAWIIGKKS